MQFVLTKGLFLVMDHAAVGCGDVLVVPVLCSIDDSLETVPDTRITVVAVASPHFVERSLTAQSPTCSR